MAPPRFGGLTDTSTAAFEVVAMSGAPGSTALGARTASGRRREKPDRGGCVSAEVRSHARPLASARFRVEIEAPHKAGAFAENHAVSDSHVGPMGTLFVNPRVAPAVVKQAIHDKRIVA
jgi:hypothetical protein